MARRASLGYGVYGVKLFDFARPEGHILVPDDEARIDPDVVETFPPYPHSPLYSNKTVAVFVLDVRTNKDPWLDGTKALQGDYVGDFLGERQWAWFEEAIQRSNAAVNVIVSGLQINANLNPYPHWAESWSSFPRAQQRLYDAVLQDGVSAPILVSGDVHMTQLMREDCRHVRDPTKRRPLVEMTTSGMTHSWATLTNAPRKDRQYKPTLYERTETLLRGYAMNLMHQVNPWTNLLSSDATLEPANGGLEGAKQGLQYSLAKNFGELEFDWDERTVTLRTMGEERWGPPLLAARVSMDQLSGKVPIPGSVVDDKDFQSKASRRHPTVANSDWVCIHHRGDVSMGRQMIGHVASAVGLIAVVSVPIVLPAIALGLLLTRTRRRFSNSNSDSRLVQSLRSSGSCVTSM